MKYYIVRGHLLNHNIDSDKQTQFSITDRTLNEFMEL